MQFLHRNPNCCAAELDGDTCLFDPDRAQYLNLNSTGSAVWNLLEQPTPSEELVLALLERYQVDEHICRQETAAFVAEALEHGFLLTLSTADSIACV